MSDSIYSVSKTFDIGGSTKTDDEVQEAGRKQLTFQEIEQELANNIECLFT